MLQRFTLGDTLEFTRSLAAYPASAGWVLHHRLLPRAQGAGAVVTFASTASGDDHVISVAAATTATWQPATYSWSAWVTDGTDNITVDQGSTVLQPNPRTHTGPLDLRSEAQIALDNVRATLRGKATADVLRYTIAGRSLERYSIAELAMLESRLAVQVAQESRAQAIANGLADPRLLQVRLGRA